MAKPRKSLMCRCDRGIFKLYAVGVVVNDPQMIKLDEAFFADCINCGATWLVDPSLESNNLMLSHTQAAQDRISEVRRKEWDSQFKPVKPVEEVIQ